MKAWPTSLVALLVACRLPSASSTTASEPAPTVFVEASPEPAQTPGPAYAIPPITPGECPPVVADTPSIFFDDRVLIRLPGDMQDGELAELSPTFVELVGITSLATCVPDRYARIEWMAIELRADEPELDVEYSLDTALSDHRLLSATLLEGEVQRDERSGDWVYRHGDSKLLVTIRSNRGQLVVAMFQVPAADWPLVLNSLRESAARTHILNQ